MQHYILKIAEDFKKSPQRDKVVRKWQSKLQEQGFDYDSASFQIQKAFNVHYYENYPEATESEIKNSELLKSFKEGNVSTEKFLQEFELDSFVIFNDSIRKHKETGQPVFLPTYQALTLNELKRMASDVNLKVEVKGRLAIKRFYLTDQIGSILFYCSKMETNTFRGLYELLDYLEIIKNKLN